MNSIALYFIQVSTTFSVLYILYVLFFSKLTFHTINRLILLLLVPLSIIIPFLNSIFSSNYAKNIIVPLYDYVNIDIQEQFISTNHLGPTEFYSFSNLIMIIYWIFFSIYIFKIVLTVRHLFLLKKKSTLLLKNGYQYMIAEVPEIFSYFNWIFVPKEKLKHYDQEILEHEKAHIKLLHSWDILITELYIAFFWFNPLLYFYRKSLKSIHEFQADRKVLDQKIKPSQYLELLLKTMDIENPNNLLHYFNHPILKKRIDMITKTRSSTLAKLKYLLLIPICTLLISAFTKPSIINNNYILNGMDVIDFSGNTPSLFPVKGGTKNDISSYFGATNRPKISQKTPHNGIDIRAKIGTPILATADGVIAKAAKKANWGNLIVITHADNYETWYAHLHKFNIRENQKVKKGDVIGYVGNTGRSTGPHLHYEVKQYQKHLNPLKYME